jgi:hypothetical protein
MRMESLGTLAVGIAVRNGSWTAIAWPHERGGRADLVLGVVASSAIIR